MKLSVVKSSVIKWATVLFLIALLFLSGACGGRGLERVPPTIDYNELQTRLDRLRAYEQLVRERERAARLGFLDWDGPGIYTNRPGVAALARRQARARELQQMLFERTRKRAATLAQQPNVSAEF